jgi:Holliday junction resolvasome RuvABC endonuclease subunit
MTAPRVVGLDLSITATGVAYPAGALDTWKPTGGDLRLVNLADRTADLVVACGPIDLAVIEDIPTHAHGAGITAMVHGAVRLELLRRHVPYALVPPATLKVYATGRGNATKPDLRMELFKRAGLDEKDDNRVDAWWLRALGLDALDNPLLALPKEHRRALAKIVWPTVKAAA